MSPTIWAWTLTADTDPALLSERADKAIIRALKEGLGEPEEGIECSRSHLQKLMEAGAVTVSGAPLVPRAKLSIGDQIVIEFPAPRELVARPENIPLEILFEDSHLVVVNKPQGLTVHPSITQADGTLVNALLYHIKDLSGIGGVLRPGIVHRIDKDTSGALVITKTDAAHRKMVEIFSAHHIERAYWALCYGVPKELSGTIDTLIGRCPTDRKKMSCQVTSGRRAISHYKVLEQFTTEKGALAASLIEVRLETGRTHQVRVHLTSLGHSILGDPAYGTPTDRATKWLALPARVREAIRALPGQALHARVLGFAHPITGTPLRFEAPPPEAFIQTLETLRSPVAVTDLSERR